MLSFETLNLIKSAKIFFSKQVHRLQMDYIFLGATIRPSTGDYHYSVPTGPGPLLASPLHEAGTTATISGLQKGETEAQRGKAGFELRTV